MNKKWKTRALGTALALLLGAMLPAPARAAGGPELRTLRLTMKKAVELALQPEGNARIQLAEEMIRQAQARSAQTRAALLPDFEASLGEQSQTRNLAAMGISFRAPIPGFSFPTFVGPFNTFDARATLTQNIFDLSSVRRFQASRLGVSAAKADSHNTSEQVSAQVARAYVAALRAEAVLQAAQANVDLSEALLRLAGNQKEAGTGTGIEVTRARVQLANDNQRLLVARNDLDAAEMRLLRDLNLRLDVHIELADALDFTPAPPQTPAEAMATALKSRGDWKAQELHEQNARLNHSATKMERLPSLVAFADYGSIGAGMNSALPTRTYGVSVRVPVFDGGRRDARRAESASLLRAETMRTGDLHDQIELEIRLALDSLRSAEAQVKTAREGLELASSELAQAQRRYEAGVANGLEVTDAQTRLARARDNHVTALFNYNLARIDLAAATGTVKQLVQ